MNNYEYKTCEYCGRFYEGYKKHCPWCEKKQQNFDGLSLDPHTPLGDNFPYIPKQEKESWNEEKYKINDIIEREIEDDITEHLHNGFRIFGIEKTLEKVEGLANSPIKDKLLQAFDLLIRR